MSPPVRTAIALSHATNTAPQVTMNDAVSALDDASVAPDLSTAAEGITPMETEDHPAPAAAE